MTDLEKLSRYFLPEELNVVATPDNFRIYSVVFASILNKLDDEGLTFETCSDETFIQSFRARVIIASYMVGLPIINTLQVFIDTNSLRQHLKNEAIENYRQILERELNS